MSLWRTRDVPQDWPAQATLRTAGGSGPVQKVQNPNITTSLWVAGGEGGREPRAAGNQTGLASPGRQGAPPPPGATSLAPVPVKCGARLHAQLPVAGRALQTSCGYRGYNGGCRLRVSPPTRPCEVPRSRDGTPVDPKKRAGQASRAPTTCQCWRGGPPQIRTGSRCIRTPGVWVDGRAPLEAAQKRARLAPCRLSSSDPCQTVGVSVTEPGLAFLLFHTPGQLWL